VLCFSFTDPRGRELREREEEEEKKKKKKKKNLTQLPVAPSR
jgi:hypothetical protein